MPDTVVTRQCPQCGRPMVVRTARQGRNRGGQFLGCSGFPACKAVLDLEASDTSESATRRSFPGRVTAAPREFETQCSFFQACGLPSILVQELHRAGVDRALVRALAQWRLDFPFPKSTAPASLYGNVLSVAEALLTRGSTPLCSPALERAVGDLSPNACQSVVETIRHIVLSPSVPQGNAGNGPSPWFQSLEERQIFRWVHALIERERQAWSLIPQIELASLSRQVDPLSAERGDLLLVHPFHAPILVEVDGQEHADHRARDGRRDRQVNLGGVQVVRVPSTEARAGRGPTLDVLQELLLSAPSSRHPESDLSRMIRWCKFHHQIQLALLSAVRGGWLDLTGPWRVGVIAPQVFSEDHQLETLISLAVADLLELLARLAELYGLPIPTAEPQVTVLDGKTTPCTLDVLVGPASESSYEIAGNTARFLISDVCLPVDLRAPLTASSPVRIAAPQREQARWFLEYLYRKEDFWEGQWEAIERSLRGLDSVVLLPTGAGKSISFQLASMLLPGRCIVIDPIISLIDDQIDNLERVGIDRCIGITSQMRSGQREEALDAFRSGHYLFCYVAPERFQNVPFREALRALTTNTPVSLIAVDEAHCISEWGHDFRTAYLNVGRVTRDYCASQGMVPPLVALTGTASKIVLKDVQRELGITSFEALITPQSFDRCELRYSILTSRSEEKVQRVIGFLQRLPSDFAMDPGGFFQPNGNRTCAGLIFCPHVNGNYGIVALAESVSRALRTRVEVYSGEVPRGHQSDQWDVRKAQVARDFKRNRLSVLACTKAFGMGIDKPNIRYTVHVGLPASIESFYQEAGRAGRDRNRAECAVVLSDDDPRRSQVLLSPATPLEEVARIVEETSFRDSDDIVRAMWFHVRAFRGERDEVGDVRRVAERLGDLESRRTVALDWSGFSDRGPAEKALHRLVVIGVVEDYTVNFSSHEFEVRVAGATREEIAAALGRYVRSYQHRLGDQTEREALALNLRNQSDFTDYVLAVAERLVRFVYQHIELARRRALNEMLQATLVSETGEDLRRRILDYLEQSEWDERLEAIRSSTRGGVDCLIPVLDDLVTPNDAAALRAATGRALASYPDVPGLLILRSVSEALSRDTDPEVVRQNLEASFSFGLGNFQLDAEELAVAMSLAIVRGRDKEGAANLLLQSCLDSGYANRPFLRVLIEHLPPELACAPATLLLNQLTRRIGSVLSLRGESH